MRFLLLQAGRSRVPVIYGRRSREYGEEGEAHHRPLAAAFFHSSSSSGSNSRNMSEAAESEVSSLGSNYYSSWVADRLQPPVSLPYSSFRIGNIFRRLLLRF